MLEFLKWFDNFLWGFPVLFLVMAGGIYFTVRLRFLPVRRLKKALFLTFQRKGKHKPGGVSSFGALCTSLAACLGTGNIVGVALAVKAGGPGAIFWMVFAAILGMSVMYTECFLAVKFRKRRADKTGYGGPFFYITAGMGEKWRFLAVMFAVFGTCAGLFGIGTFTQANSITEAVLGFLKPDKEIGTWRLGTEGLRMAVMISMAVTLAAALVLLGGIKRIAAFSQIVVPFMAAGFLGICVLILIKNAGELPRAFGEIVKGAFSPGAVAGGTAGSLWVVIRTGVSRGIFSNEAGMGSAPIAAASSDEEDPEVQGLVSMTGTFIDTVVMCTVTGLVLVVTDAWRGEELEGVSMTVWAVAKGLGVSGRFAAAAVMISLTFFAFTSILGWNHYAVSCFSFLVGEEKRSIKRFQVLYIIAVFLGGCLPAGTVWVLADIFNGCMAIPNMTALLCMRHQVAENGQMALAQRDGGRYNEAEEEAS